MSGKWTARAGNKGLLTGVDESVLDERAVVLLQGKNHFGDDIYSFVNITVRDYARMRQQMLEGRTFLPSDFGEVLAAGKGKPSPEITREIEGAHGKLERLTPQPQPIPPPPKVWNEAE